MNPTWHFPIMILASLAFFVGMLRVILPKIEFKTNAGKIAILSLVVVVVGMTLGKYGAMAGLPWWVYYPVPMMMTVIAPPVVLKFNTQRTVGYLILSFLSAPIIHACFSLLLGWTEYMPFLKIPAL